MSKVRIYGDTSGYVDIAVPAVAGTRTLNLDKVPQTDTNGNTGIGTDTPFTRAVVGDGTGTEVLTIFSGATGEGQLRFADASSGTGAYQGRVEYDHNAGKLNLGAGGATPVTIDSSGNVGVGTNGPDQKMHLYTGAGTTLYKAEVNANSTVGLEIKKTGSTTQSWRIVDGETVNGALQFYDVTDSRVSMQIDGTGALLVGKTAANFATAGTEINSTGRVLATFDGGGPLQLNRLTSFGDIIELHKDGAEVGAIGSPYGNELYIEGTGANSSGLLFTSGNSIQPRKNNASDDGNIDIGTSGNRFKDLHLAGDALVDGHLRLYTTDDQANQWYVYNYTDDTLRFNYNGAGNDEAIFYTNGNVDFATNQTTSVRINSNARTNTGLNVGGASSTATGIYVDNSDGSATLDIAVLGSSYGSHGASAGEVWFYSPDNINIGGATGSTNEVRMLGSGGIRHNFYNTGYTGDPTDAGTFHFKGKGGNQLSILTAAYTAGAGTSIGTSNVQVVNSAFGALVFVAGYGSGQFCDLVYFGYNASPTIIAQQTIAGSPPSRIYTGSGYALYLRYSSSTLTTKVNCIQSHS